MPTRSAAPTTADTVRVPDLSDPSIKPRFAAADLVPTACPVCGRTGGVPVVRRPDALVVVECKQCRVAYLEPRPSDSVISRLYDANYFGRPRDQAVSGYGYVSYLDGMDDLSLARLKVVSTVRNLRSARLMEIGCATGEFAAAASSAGASVTAIDVSDEVIEIARSRYPGIDFRSGSLEDVSSDLASYDVICAFEVIEHVPDVRRFMHLVSGLARPGTTVFLSTPNYDHALDVGVDRWIGFRMSLEHLVYLSRQAIEAVANEAGLRPVTWYTYGSGIWQKPSDGGLRDLARGALARVGLLEVSRRFRAARKSRPVYAERTPGHQLLVVLEK